VAIFLDRRSRQRSLDRVLILRNAPAIVSFDFVNATF
jgi:hypothetical protein